MKMGSPFLNVLPSLDIHGHTRETMYVVVSDFINDNIKLGNSKIVIIHGIGLKVLSNELKLRFYHDKRVKNIYLSPDNSGCSILELNI